MFKKAFQVAVSFALLCGGYLGYAEVFAVLVARSQAKLTHDTQAKRPPKVENASLREATQLAGKHFGADHWSARPDLQYRFYHHDKGYWFYAENLVRSVDGKTLTLNPFVSIWREPEKDGKKDGRAVKTISSKEAIIQMDQPIGLGKGPGGAESRIVNVRINHDVQIRDDKGTTTPNDDLKIAMNSVEYDEGAMEIRTDSEVVVQDRDFWMTGTGLRMQLFPKPGGASGFQGVRTATFKHDVHIIIKDVGRSGVLPGKATAEATGRTPLDLTNDGSMVILFPRPAAKVIIGPPEAPRPTIAEFATNVRVLRGATNPDQLNSDFLRLILLPIDKEKAAAERKAKQAETLAAAGPKSSAPAPVPVVFVAKADGASPGEGSAEGVEAEASGPMTELGLKEAMATGHAVWLRSPSQGVTGRGNQLIYKNLSPERPNETYFRGDAGRGMEIDKVDLADVDPKAPAGTPRAVKSVTKIRAVDATNYDAGPGPQGGSVVIARGPGTLESRPAATLPVERSAAWRDQLIMETTGVGLAQRRKITLTDHPRLSMSPKPGAKPAVAAAQGIVGSIASPVSSEGPTILDADKMIVAYLSPKAPAAAPGTVAAAPRDAALVRTAAGPAPVAESVESGTVRVTAPATGTDSMKVDKLLALENVHLQAPGKTMRARDQLDVEFEQGTVLEKPAPAKAPAPVVAAPAEPAALAELPPPMNAGPEVTPPVHVSANRVWAKIIQAAGKGNEGGDVREVRLRGSVAYHQDAAPTKERGTDVTGEALDLNRDVAGLAKLVVFHRDPSGAAPKAAGRPLAPATGAAVKAPERMARVVMPEMQVEGPVIGLDQAADHSWVRGPGLLTMMADRAAAGSDTGLGGGSKNKDKDGSAKATASVRPSTVNELDLPLLNRRPTADPEAADRVPMTITWVDRMDFYGQPAGADGRPGPGKINFVGGVRAASDEGLINSDTLDATLDGPIAFNRAASGTATPGAPKPQISRVHLRGKALVVNSERNPVTGEVDEKQRILSEEVIYDRLSGYFNAPGPGTVFLYSRSDAQDSTGLGGMSDVGGMASRTKPSITNASNSNAGASTKGVAAAGAKRPLNLTQISFQNGMYGKFGSGPASDPRGGPRQAEFFKDVDVMHAEVPSVDVILNPDRPPRKFVTLTSQSLRVISEPSRKPGGRARNLLDAWDEAYARTENSTIQADRIRYDSATELFNAYAFSGRDVVMSQQTIVGQPPTQAVGRGIIFNRLTGERELIEPQTVQLLNQKQGARPTPLPPPSDKPAPKDRRKGFAPPQQNNKERRGFSGGRF
ncbi:hypothetical protein EP7_000143 [Isosphaeraceae bacterium EP7]